MLNAWIDFFFFLISWYFAFVDVPRWLKLRAFYWRLNCALNRTDATRLLGVTSARTNMQQNEPFSLSQRAAVCHLFRELLCNASFFHFAHRYTAIVRPNEYEDLKARFMKRAIFSALAVWSLGFINATIPIVDGSGYSFYEVTGTCTVNWSAISFGATCIIESVRFVLPFAISTFSYGKIYYMAKRAKRKVNPCPEPRNRQSQCPTKSNSSEDTYLSNSTSRNQSTNMASSSSSGTLSSSRSASIEDNILSKGDSGIGQTKHFNKIHHELVVNDVGKTIQAGLVRTDTQPDIPYSMTSALSRISKRPDACHGMTPWQRAVANRLTKRKVFRSMILLYGAFLFSWTPYVVWTFFVQFLKDPSSVSSKIVFIIAISNSLLNVYLYGFVKSTYRKALKGCLKKNLSVKRFRKTIAMQVQRADVATISRSIHTYGKRQSEVRYKSRVEKEREYTSQETNNEYSNRITLRTQSLPDAKKFSHNRHC